MKQFALCMAIGTGLLLMGFSAGDLRHEMVKLDKVYIAALALSNQGKIDESRKAIKALRDAWQAFSAKHADANPSDKQWRADFSAVEKRVAKAVTIVETPGQKLTEAHEALEEVRNVLMRLRQRNRIDYYIDGLTAFHHPMEEIALAVKDKTAQSLSEADIAEIRGLLPQVEQYWRAVEAAHPDTATYQLSPAQADDVAKLVKLESAALAGLKEALAGGDKAQIVKTAIAIKPNFAKLFMTFANFEPYQK
jgi:flagellin-specific chaperone FliS